MLAECGNITPNPEKSGAPASQAKAGAATGTQVGGAGLFHRCWGMSPLRLLTMSAVVLGLAVASPAQAQRIADVDASNCVTDPEGQAYFSLYGMVFAVEPHHIHNFYRDLRLPGRTPGEVGAARLERFSQDRWPAPSEPDASMGCPGNPIITPSLALTFTYGELGFAEQVHRHPELIAEIPMGPPGDTGDWPWTEVPNVILRVDGGGGPHSLGITPELVDEYCQLNNTEMAPHLYACYRWYDSDTYFWHLNFQYFYVADDLIYQSPDHNLFYASCRRSLRQGVDQDCNVYYRIHPSLNLSYRLNLTHNPFHQVIPVDSAMRQFVGDHFRPELSHPFVGTVDDLSLPAIDHHQLIEAELEAHHD